jgi:predicted DNA binding protein
MINFVKPLLLNGAQLINELNASGIQVQRLPFIDDNGDFWLDIDEKNKSKAESIVAAHIGVDEQEVQASQKAALLARLGLTEDELKTILG